MKFYGFDSIGQLQEHAARTEWVINSDDETVTIEGVGTFNARENEFRGEMTNEPRHIGDYDCYPQWAPGYINYFDMEIWIPINQVCKVKLSRHYKTWRETGEVLG